MGRVVGLEPRTFPPVFGIFWNVGFSVVELEERHDPIVFEKGCLEGKKMGGWVDGSKMLISAAWQVLHLQEKSLGWQI